MATIKKEKALDVVRQMVADGQVSQEVAEKYFPELKESKKSEDEKIKGAAIEFVRQNMSFNYRLGISKEEVIAWLEKQGEQKPIDKIQLGKKYKCIASPRYSTFMKGEIYKPEDKFLCSLMNFCYDCFEPIEDGEQKSADKVEPNLLTVERAKEISPFMRSGFENESVGWSEEDEKEVAVLEAYIRSKDWSERHIDRALGIVDELVNKVKSPRPRNNGRNVNITRQCPFCGAEKAAETHEDENQMYYHCPECDRHFSDEDAEHEILRQKVSSICSALEATEEHPIDCTRPEYSELHIGGFDEQAQGLSEAEKPQVLTIFQDAEGIVWFTSDFTEGPVELDSILTDSIQEILSWLEEEMYNLNK